MKNVYIMLQVSWYAFFSPKRNTDFSFKRKMSLTLKSSYKGTSIGVTSSLGNYKDKD